MLTFIVNPTAGGGYAERVWQKISLEMDRRGVAYDVQRTNAPHHATQLAHQAAASAACDAVIAVGGDGTSFEVASGLMGSGKPMGIIPAGTGNDFLKTIKLPRDPLQAIDFILSHTPRPVDVGKVNDRWFLNVCGAGFDVTVLEEAALATRKMRGMLPYLYGVIRAIKQHRPLRIRYTVDGHLEVRDVLLLSVANGRYIGGGIPICPKADPADGMLDLTVVELLPRWKIPFYLPGLMLGRIQHFQVSHHVRCRAVQVVCPMMRMQIDGEIYSMNEVHFAIEPGGLLLYW